MKLQLAIVVFANIFLVAFCGADDGPEVELSSGRLLGKYMKTIHDREFSGFLGIPFAKPPVGELRFKEPQNPEPWKGKRNATIDGAECIQKNPFIQGSLIEGSEDCLYLNVFTPELPKAGGKLLPVMVFIHGGGWMCGAGTTRWYGPDMLLDKDVVLVTPNYRLGLFGFLTTGDDVVPGNMALKDQYFALKWIQENIAKFGGDPNQVTIFGESAGGASVHYLMLSPLSKDLVHGGIMQSGTALSTWAIDRTGDTKANTKKIAKSFNCPTDSTEKLVECLRTINPQDIIENYQIFVQWYSHPMISFKPVIEHEHPGAFLTEDPETIIKEGKMADVPVIIGLNKDEGAILAAGLGGNPQALKEYSEDFDHLGFLTMWVDKYGLNKKLVMEKVKEFYFDNKPIDENALDKIVDLHSDAWFLAAIDKTIKLHRKYNKSPIYYYYFNYRGVASFSEIFGDPKRDYGVCHADELQYLFPVGKMLFPHKQLSESDKKMVDLLSGLWTNFATKGDPNSPTNNLINETWKPVTSNEMEHLRIERNGQANMGKNLLRERAQFWKLLLTLKENEFDKVQDEL